nr:MAG TPA: hypothetical protein [Caudoviricetes sp.]
MCCVPALFIVIAAVQTILQRGLILGPSCCLPIEGQIEN